MPNYHPVCVVNYHPVCFVMRQRRRSEHFRPHQYAVSQAGLVLPFVIEFIIHYYHCEWPGEGRSRMTIGDEIEYISLYKPLHIAFHGYIAPFVVSYAILVFLWVGVYGLWDYREVFLIAIAGVAALDFLLCLFCVWSVHLRCFVTCKKV